MLLIVHIGSNIISSNVLKKVPQEFPPMFSPSQLFDGGRGTPCNPEPPYRGVFVCYLASQALDEGAAGSKFLQ
jgi:hypothetical protein